LATNNNEDGKKVFVNGEEAPPINKRKLPPSIDWQAKVKAKQAEIDRVTDEP
jgi:hypothetical protein